jgi:hypothetical protein
MAMRIRLRHVPDALYRRLAALADEAELSLPDFLIAAARAFAERPAQARFRRHLAARRERRRRLDS